MAKKPQVLRPQVLQLVNELTWTSNPGGPVAWGDKPSPGPPAKLQNLAQPPEKRVTEKKKIGSQARCHYPNTSTGSHGWGFHRLHNFIVHVFSAIPEWQQAACLEASCLQRLLQWTLLDSSLDQRETILFLAKHKSYTYLKCTLVSCHHCPGTNKQSASSPQPKAKMVVKWLPAPDN